jgi:hypothetical protein
LAQLFSPRGGRDPRARGPSTRRRNPPRDPAMQPRTKRRRTKLLFSSVFSDDCNDDANVARHSASRRDACVHAGWTPATA